MPRAPTGARFAGWFDRWSAGNPRPPEARPRAALEILEERAAECLARGWTHTASLYARDAALLRGGPTRETACKSR